MSKRGTLGIFFIVVLLGAYAVSARFMVHQQLYAYWKNLWHGNQAPDKNIWLPDYKAVIQAKPVADITNLSGIAYDPEHDRLLGITNGVPMQIVAMSRNGDLLERYPLIGFQDTEGLAYMGNGRVVIADEQLQRLYVVTLPDSPGPIHVENAPFVAIEINLSEHNKGFEGVTYDAANDRIFAIKERDPRQLFTVTGMLTSIGGPLQIHIKDLTHWIDRSVFGLDLSEGYYDPRTGHLLLLSEQSSNVTELDQDGNFVSFRSLLGLNDLKKTIPQAEGMTMDTSGELYIVSEPNLFYRFSKSKAAVAENQQKH
ncbi:MULTISPECIES: SdiA-regulated domain-containing protein [Pseudomonas]|uniref:SdiA-regulated n=1 Tax=Pseudomonas frederiksbergensis TaxID=104087 RepID=A0A2S8HAY8_9PSED|nr:MULTISPECIES: SdiA-regulated domain-containing protein [Pseudomonas]PQO99655.1 SdiA-regulated [Pseudomonas frederiksbergensis]WLG48986.1 SdiA-regulated domain-containing protein [Pseudomonas sp. FP1742]